MLMLGYQAHQTLQGTVEIYDQWRTERHLLLLMNDLAAGDRILVKELLCPFSVQPFWIRMTIQVMT